MSGRLKEDLTGRTFGRLTVLAHVGSAANRQSRWRCQCNCGKEVIVPRSSLVDGHTRSCGCLHARVNGEARNGKQTPEYTAWAQMKKRCANKNDPDYGGRGIRVCKPWSDDYLTFLSDVGRRPSPKHSLDRINVNGHYEPRNVRWATAKEQHHNRRAFQYKGWRQSAKHAWNVVKDFERVIASYTGAPYAVAVDSCTNALLLAVAYHQRNKVVPQDIEIPRFTYVGVPMSIRNAGAIVSFRDEAWTGMYQLKHTPIYDAARIFTSGMYRPGTMMCLSFHWTKHLRIGRGGAILCDDKAAVAWLKRARFDGRSEGVAPKSDKFPHLGWHVVMSPASAAQGLLLMAGIEEHNEPLPWGPGTSSDYVDLSKLEIFQ